MEGFPPNDNLPDPPPGLNNRRDRPRPNFHDDTYPPYNPHQPAPPPRNPPYFHPGYQGDGYHGGHQENNGYRNYQEEQEREQRRREEQKWRDEEQKRREEDQRRRDEDRRRREEEQRRRDFEERYPNIKPEFKTMRDQIATAQRHCSELLPLFDRHLEIRNDILAPVYENFKENHRKLQDYYFEAQDDLIKFKSHVSLYEGAARSLFFMIQQKLIRYQKVDKHLLKSGVNIPEQRGDHGTAIGKMDTLLDECRQAIERLMKSWEEERAKPKELKPIYDGDAIIEEVDDEDSEVLVERKIPVANDEVAELKREVAGMKFSMDEMKMDMQEMKELLKLAIQQSSVKAEVPGDALRAVVSELLSSQEESSSQNGRVVSRSSGNGGLSNFGSEQHRQEPSRNGHHRGESSTNFGNARNSEPHSQELAGSWYEDKDTGELKKDDNGNRFESMRHQEGPRRSDQGNGQSSRYESDLPPTDEDDHHDYRRDNRRYQHDHYRGGPSNLDARRSDSPHYYNRADDGPDFSDHDHSPTRSSRSRNDRGDFSPARSHQSRNRYDSYDRNGRGQNMDFDDHRYSGPNHHGDHQGGYSRESSRTRGYSPQHQHPLHGHDEIDGINYARPPSHAGHGPSKQPNPRQQGFKKDDFCAYCKKSGHIKTQCPKKKCKNCGGAGHKADVCTSKRFN